MLSWLNVNIRKLANTTYQLSESDLVQGSWCYKFTAFVLLLIALLFLIHILPPQGGVIEVRLHSDQVGMAQWFFDRGEGYSEAESVTVALRPGENRIRFVLAPGMYRNLRFDPINSDGRVTIEELRLTLGSRGASDLISIEALSPLANIAEFNPTPAGIIIVPSIGNSDPQLQLKLSQPLSIQVSKNLAADLFLAIVATGFVLILLHCVFVWLTLQQWVTIGMAVALALMIALATLVPSTINIHPDEPLHFACFNYFLDHFWPGAITDSAMVSSLTASPFGYSYLSEYDVVYFFAAHSTSSLITLFGSTGGAARAFQYALWFVLILFSARKQAWAATLAVLLISPQIWYVFSYFNGDAFPLFLSIIAAMLASDTDGGVKRFLDGGRLFEPAIFGLALCIGLLIVSKSNYLPLVPGLFLWFAVRHLGLKWLELLCALSALALFGTTVFFSKIPTIVGLHSKEIMLAGGISMLSVSILNFIFRYRRDPSIGPAFLRLSALFTLSFIIASPRIIDDIWLNGLPTTKSEKVVAAAEKYAAPNFKPSILATGEGYKTGALAQKGLPLGQMLFNPYNWFGISAASAFGVYGYMNIVAPRGFYLFIGWCGLGIVVTASIALIRIYPSQGTKLLFVALGTCALILISSILYSWIVGFQAQGRYLLPMAMMIALIFGATLPHGSQKLIRLMLLVMLALSVYSYACVGLPALVAQANS